MKFTNEPNLDEPHLILEASHGNLDAFNQLVLLYQDLMFNQAYALLGNCHAAEDATQKSFMKAFQKMSGFRQGYFRAWLLRIVTNTCYDEIRWSKRHPTIPLLLDDEEGKDMEAPLWLTAPDTSVEGWVEQSEFSRLLSRMLAELPEIYRVPITLIDVHELAYSEVAVALGIPIGTVKSRVARARFRMKEKLQNKFGASVFSGETTSLWELSLLNERGFPSDFPVSGSEERQVAWGAG